MSRILAFVKGGAGILESRCRHHTPCEASSPGGTPATTHWKDSEGRYQCFFIPSSFFMLSFDMLSFDMLSLDIVSLDIESFFMLS